MLVGESDYCDRFQNKAQYQPYALEPWGQQADHPYSHGKLKAE